MRWRRRASWEPHDLAWRIAVLFMVGSFLFALGSFPPYALLVDPRIVGLTFVAGSIFFTSAGYSQFVQVVNSDDAGVRSAGPQRSWGWQPGRVLWWAATVQLAGTLFFNASTIDAMLGGLTTEQANRLVWAPDFFGSICFLVASHLAWLFVCGRVRCVRTGDRDWWVAGLNYLGSIFFMASGIAAFTLPTTGDILNIAVVNLGTFLGAICFFVGGYLLLPAAE